jgi:hypothetical protein
MDRPQFRLFFYRTVIALASICRLDLGSSMKYDAHRKCRLAIIRFAHSFSNSTGGIGKGSRVRLVRCGCHVLHGCQRPGSSSCVVGRGQRCLHCRLVNSGASIGRHRRSTSTVPLFDLRMRRRPRWRTADEFARSTSSPTGSPGPLRASFDSRFCLARSSIRHCGGYYCSLQLLAQQAH